MYEKGMTSHSNGLTAGRYFAAVECSRLPRRLTREDHVIRRGYAVGFGEWFFFDAIEPAITFGRAARMSIDCHGYGVYEAAHETRHCLRHGDERVLLVDFSSSLDRRDGEVEVLARFVEGVKRYPGSAYWGPPPRARTR
jgi:hypothetical protein